MTKCNKYSTSYNIYKIPKRLIILFIFTCLFVVLQGQVTYSPSVKSKNNDGVIESVTITDSETIVRIRYPKQYQVGSWVSFSSNTIMCPMDEFKLSDLRSINLVSPSTDMISYGYADLYKQRKKEYNETRQILWDYGYLIRSLGDNELDTRYIATKSDTFWELHFGKMPVGATTFVIRELISDGFEWTDIVINNPYPIVQRISMNEEQIKESITDCNDGIVGIYESLVGNKYRLACIKDGNIYKLIYLSSGVLLNQWSFGDIKAILEPSATYGLFKVKWHMVDKIVSDGLLVFNGSMMSVTIEKGGGATEDYIKMFPSTDNSSHISGSTSMGSGFALQSGYIATNFHVVDGAKSIAVKGINGDFSKSYTATIAASDKPNDLAILKINDSKFEGFGAIPYSLRSSMCEVGESVWTLGYPMTNVMGDEIKFTDGKISSKTGIQGDISVYQISVPIQPGNSGGALFDISGNIIGITSSGLNRGKFATENVNYAIKIAYLKSLVECTLDNKILPTGKSLLGQVLPDQIKIAKKFIFIIECKY